MTNRLSKWEPTEEQIDDLLSGIPEQDQIILMKGFMSAAISFQAAGNQALGEKVIEDLKRMYDRYRVK